jgi:hypothetical protein
MAVASARIPDFTDPIFFPLLYGFVRQTIVCGRRTEKRFGAQTILFT